MSSERGSFTTSTTSAHGGNGSSASVELEHVWEMRVLHISFAGGHSKRMQDVHVFRCVHRAQRGHVVCVGERWMERVHFVERQVYVVANVGQQVLLLHGVGCERADLVVDLAMRGTGAEPLKQYFVECRRVLHQ